MNVMTMTPASTGSFGSHCFVVDFSFLGLGHPKGPNGFVRGTREGAAAGESCAYVLVETGTEEERGKSVFSLPTNTRTNNFQCLPQKLSVSISAPPTLASVCGKTIVLKSSPMTKVTVPRHRMSRLRTASD